MGRRWGFTALACWNIISPLLTLLALPSPGGNSLQTREPVAGFCSFLTAFGYSRGVGELGGVKPGCLSWCWVLLRRRPDGARAARAIPVGERGQAGPANPSPSLNPTSSRCRGLFQVQGNGESSPRISYNYLQRTINN